LKEATAGFLTNRALGPSSNTVRFEPAAGQPIRALDPELDGRTTSKPALPESKWPEALLLRQQNRCQGKNQKILTIRNVVPFSEIRKAGKRQKRKDIGSVGTAQPTPEKFNAARNARAGIA